MPAPDYAVELARLQTILDAGATRIEIDGKVTEYDLEAIRRQRDEYQSKAALAAEAKPPNPSLIRVRFPTD
jgi:hypothetical protein